ncbi:MAG: hypothetical protein MRERV_13c019 [Mycoplasmataceae bacterium RV_VA103A]|nr:MAG: hypothetical protein MRERV_13c019 [Mycoplasmataceae bacterium RV_VA103A]
MAKDNLNIKNQPLSIISQKYPTILSLKCSKEVLVADLSDGRSVSIPTAWFPRLRKTTLKQLNKFEIAFDGEDITWPELDEDISVKTFIDGLQGSCC